MKKIKYLCYTETLHIFKKREKINKKLFLRNLTWNYNYIFKSVEIREKLRMVEILHSSSSSVFIL